MRSTPTKVVHFSEVYYQRLTEFYGLELGVAAPSGRAD